MLKFRDGRRLVSTPFVPRARDLPSKSCEAAGSTHRDGRGLANETDSLPFSRRLRPTPESRPNSRPAGRFSASRSSCAALRRGCRYDPAWAWGQRCASGVFCDSRRLVRLAPTGLRPERGARFLRIAKISTRAGMGTIGYIFRAELGKEG